MRDLEVRAVRRGEQSNPGPLCSSSALTSSVYVTDDGSERVSSDVGI
jgi:hypothetical protein